MTNRRHNPHKTATPVPRAKQQLQVEPRPFATVDRQITPHAPAQTESTSPVGRGFGQVQIHAGSPARIQAKLMVGPAGDHYEHEADRLAAQVMSMPEPAGDAGFEAGVATAPTVQRAGGGAGFEAGANIERSLSSQNGAGSPLPAATRDFMEPRFGADFSGVRLHTDTQAADMNQQLNAHAFTHGQDIYLGAGSYAPGTSAGQHLLAHELTHVVQQSGPAIQRQYLGRPASASLTQTVAPRAAVETGVVARKTIQRFTAAKFFPSDKQEASDYEPPDARAYLTEKFTGYAKLRNPNSSIKVVIDAITKRGKRPDDTIDFEELTIELFNTHIVSAPKRGYGLVAVASFADIRERIGAPALASPATAAVPAEAEAEAESEEPVDIDQDALEAYALELGLSPADIERLKKLKDAKEGKFDFITEDGDSLALDIKAKKIKIGWGASDDEEGDSIEISKDKVAFSIGGYGVSCENKPDGQAAKMEFPEIRAPAEGMAGPTLRLSYPLDPAGITSIGVSLGLTGFISLKPTLDATRTVDAHGKKNYNIRGTIVPSGSIMAEAAIFAEAGYSVLAKAEAGLFGRGGVTLDATGSTIAVTGNYDEHPDGTNAGSLEFAPTLKGIINAQAGAYAKWSFLNDSLSKRYEYIFKEWEIGKIDYKKVATLTVARGAGLRLPSLEQTFVQSNTKIPFKGKKVTETTPLLAGRERSDA